MTIKTTRMFYDMNNVTHEDAGTYIALDNVGNKLNRHTLQVQGEGFTLVCAILLSETLKV